MAFSGEREYEPLAGVLQRHLGFAGVVERAWAGISPDEAPSEDEAARIVAEELAAACTERGMWRSG